MDRLSVSWTVHIVDSTSELFFLHKMINSSEMGSKKVVAEGLVNLCSYHAVDLQDLHF